jgi:hypothetical protein
VHQNTKRIAIALLLLLLAGAANKMHFTRQQHSMLTDTGTEATQATPTVNLLLGGFRGVVADWLWIRAMILQEQGRFVEILQLAEWITALQPQFPDIWTLHAWNLAYNITVLLPDGLERWRWVRHGYEILRDQAIPATRFHTRVCTELAWILMHKIAGTTDDFADTLFSEWVRLQEPLFDVHGRLPVEPSRREAAIRQIGIPASIITTFETDFGKHDWRHPLTHAAAWAYTGFTLHPGREGSIMAERLFLTTYRQLFMQGQLAIESNSMLLLPDIDRLQGVRKAFAHASERQDRIAFQEAHMLTLELLAQILLSQGMTELAKEIFTELATTFPDAPAAKQGFAALAAHAKVAAPRRIPTTGDHRP